MTKITILSTAALLSASAFVGCNSDVTYPSQDTSSNVAVYSFSLQADSKILEGLDSVFFSIDLDKARIFNADSLPYGTRINRLIPSITVVENVTSITLDVPRPGKADTTYNYITNPNDSIDFSNGPVKLNIISENSLATRTYLVSVNVHTVKSDSLQWTTTAYRNLPTVLNAPTKQKTVSTNNMYYCLTQDATDTWSLSKAEDPSGSWTTTPVSLPATADINSFTAAGDALYILASEKLLSSTDGSTWTDTAVRFTSLYGSYEGRLLGARHGASSWKIAEYPGNTEYDMPEGMPIYGTSQLVTFDFEMSQSKQAIMMGGILPDGTRSSKAWAFDGSNWVCLTSQPIDKALSNISLVPFYTFRTDGFYKVKKYVALLAIGGTDGSEVNRTVYTSVDYGMTWTSGSETIQLPSFIPTLYGSDAFVAESTLSLSRSTEWKELPMSRATEAITEWECPYIYLFGGYDKEGKLSDAIWRGTINRLAFKPLQ